MTNELSLVSSGEALFSAPTAEDVLKHPFVSDKFRTTQLIKIPCDTVKLLAKFNQRNRPLSKGVLESYMHRMKNGLWKSTAANPIRIGKDLAFLDGQHRVVSAALLGVELETVVFYGEEPEDMYYIDGGYARKPADNVILGNKEYENTLEQKSQLSNWFTVANCWLNMEPNNQLPQKRRDPLLLEKFVEAHPSIKDVCVSIENPKAKRAGLRCAMAQYIEKDPIKGKIFFEEVTGGGSLLMPGSATLKIRNHIDSKKRPSSGSEQQILDYERTVYAIHKFHANETVNNLGRKNTWDF